MSMHKPLLSESRRYFKNIESKKEVKPRGEGDPSVDKFLLVDILLAEKRK